MIVMQLRVQSAGIDRPIASLQEFGCLDAALGLNRH